MYTYIEKAQHISDFTIAESSKNKNRFTKGLSLASFLQVAHNMSERQETQTQPRLSDTGTCQWLATDFWPHLDKEREDGFLFDWFVCLVSSFGLALLAVV